MVFHQNKIYVYWSKLDATDVIVNIVPNIEEESWGVQRFLFQKTASINLSDCVLSSYEVQPICLRLEKRRPIFKKAFAHVFYIPSTCHLGHSLDQRIVSP
jgi:hypothetical protein